MGLDLEYIDGQTPIDEDEREGLLIEIISTKAELDEFEQKNIEEAMQWVIGRKFNSRDVFSEKFICNIHRRMFKNVWAWAGEFRKTNKNIGVDKLHISTKLKVLCDDALYWIENKTFGPDEIAVRFKHRIVSIHCFPNGNGRHSRLMGDIIIENLFGEKSFSWGAGNLSRQGDARATYLKALKAADRSDFAPLLDFARS
jgi:Fic-DOC domain mobile mystery protein B